MDQVTKNAPFGTDNTPTLEYKIVGGKRVEVVATNEANEIKKRNKLNFFSPRGGPHGTPPMQTQPFYQEYEYADLQKGYNTALQHNTARKVTSYTSPFGDRTQSFRHGPPILNKHAVLPPIGASQPPGHKYASDLPSAEELQIKEQNLSSSTIESLVAQKLKGYPVGRLNLKDLYIELSSFDRELSGFVTENQLSLILLRHDLPFKMSLLKMIYNKFSDPKEPRMVNYEKFLQFLATCMSDGDTNDQELHVSNSRNRSSSKNAEEEDKMLSVKSGITNILMTCPVDDKFVTMVKEQLAGSDDWDLGQLYATLNTSDRLRNNQLTADVIMRSCMSERVPLTSSILTSMLQQAEIDHGKVDWRQFLAPLACAYFQLYPSSRLLDTSATRQGSGVQTNQSEARPTNVSNLTSRKQSSPDATVASKVSRRDHLSAGWDEKEPRGSTNPLSKESSAGAKSEKTPLPLRTENWVRNFTRLSHALKSYHPYKTARRDEYGKNRQVCSLCPQEMFLRRLSSFTPQTSDRLPRSEVDRMVSNYNLIYGLGFSPGQLTNAVERSVVEKKPDGRQMVSVDSLLGILMASTTK